MRRRMIEWTGRVGDALPPSVVRPMERAVAWALGRDAVGERVLAPQVTQAERLRSALHETTRLNGVVSDAQSSAAATGHDSPTDAPVFILSAGWGSGSTLLQRLAVSSREVLVWGEPYDQAAPVQRLAETLMPLRVDWPPETHFVEDLAPETLGKGWIANLAPPPESYIAAHRAYFDRWLAEPARRAGYARWGLKEVRLTIDHARYLKTLYPAARFVFVYRDLYASYLSCRGKPWLSVWPDRPATPIVAFAHHWRRLLEGFLEGYESVDGMLVRYEDLARGAIEFDTLARHLSVTGIDEQLLAKRVGARATNRHPLILPERLVLDGIAGDLRRRLGYRS